MQIVSGVLITEEDLCALFTRHVLVTSNYGSRIKRAAETNFNFGIITNKLLKIVSSNIHFSALRSRA